MNIGLFDGKIEYLTIRIMGKKYYKEKTYWRNPENNKIFKIKEEKLKRGIWKK